jgi:hypothetical protein
MAQPRIRRYWHNEHFPNQFNTVGYAEKHFPNFVKVNNKGRKYVNEERFPNTVDAELAAQGLKAATEEPAVGDRVIYAPLDGISVWTTVESPLLENILLDDLVNGHQIIQEGLVYKLRTDDGRIIRPFKEDMKYHWDMYVPVPDRLSMLANVARRSRSRSRNRRSRSRNRKRNTRNNQNA